MRGLVLNNLERIQDDKNESRVKVFVMQLFFIECLEDENLYINL